MMKKQTFLFLIAMLITTSLVAKSKRVIGYYAGWTGLPVSEVQVSKLTHINYAFANIVDGQPQFMLKEDPALIKALVKKRDLESPSTKLLFSIGGWVWSNHFSDAALTNASRVKFAKGAVSVMKEYKFDGIDLDWEYPGQLGEDNTYRAEDSANFNLLLKTIREELDKEEKHYLLTIATGADKAYTDNTDLGEAQKYLDFINIMTYDMYGGFDHTTGHHANLFKAEVKNGAKEISGDGAIERHLKEGVPADKLVLGIPFYGRRWKKVSKDTEDGLWASAEEVGYIIAYKTIRTECTKEKGYTQYWDKKAKVPYLYNEQENVFISYENPKSMRIKLKYVKRQKLGGVMFWEYSDDYKNELLNTISK
ncbi:glycoside hydrolase family 18 protein [Halosquirtibacter xylanolyticus]|uniref:glycoside hydrolase family 18 protein n=1 Tax=Halosquirtibacter xylanolyticus TaxID=3374599 RepID=UPI0037479343|nr:glycoside hydrolase family 18 protein [Prolixibacteraceae bacterium]